MANWRQISGELVLNLIYPFQSHNFGPRRLVCLNRNQKLWSVMINFSKASCTLLLLYAGQHPTEYQNFTQKNFEENMVAYLQCLLDLYSNIQLCPNHHAALHIGPLLTQFRPVHGVMNSGLSFLSYLFLSMHHTHHFHCFISIVSPWLKLRLVRLRSSICSTTFIIYTRFAGSTTTSLQPHCTQPLFTNYYLNHRTE